MKAIKAKSGSDAQDPGAFILEEQPIPEPGEQDLLVRVLAIGMNPVDTKVRVLFEGNCPACAQGESGKPDQRGADEASA